MDQIDSAAQHRDDYHKSLQIAGESAQRCCLAVRSEVRILELQHRILVPVTLHVCEVVREDGRKRNVPFLDYLRALVPSLPADNDTRVIPVPGRKEDILVARWFGAKRVEASTSAWHVIGCS